MARASTFEGRAWPAAVVAVALWTWGAAAQTPGPDLFSKRYGFRTGVTLDIAETHPAGLRLDSVEFELPAPSGERLIRTGGLVQARVAVSNTGSVPQRVGLAIALFDGEGRLLGVAGGGNKLTPIKPERQKTFQLVFDGVNAEAHRATAFQISMEPNP